MWSETTGDSAFDSLLRSLRPSRQQRLTVHLVANQVRGDSRVLKSAQVSQQLGHAALIIGITPEASMQSFEVDGVPALLVPMSIEGSDRTILLQGWQRWDRFVSLHRAVGRSQQNTSFRSRVRSIGRAFLRSASETSWSKRRPGLLDINLRFATALASVRPQLVHVHDAHGLPAAVAYRAKSATSRGRTPRVLYDSHECIPLAAERFPKSAMHQALSLIEREFVAMADEVLTVSHPIAAYLHKHYALTRLPDVVHNCPQVHSEDSNPDVRSTIGLDQGSPLAVYSGWLEQQRGVETAVRALALVPALHLALVVSKESRELTRLREIARELGVTDRLHTAPYVRPSQVADYLTTATFGVLPFEPSPHLSMSLPTKYYEYTAARLPSLATDFGELAREIKVSGFGRVFQPGDSHDFAKESKKLLEDIDSFKDTMHKADLSKYVWESQAPQLGDAYGRLLPGGDPAYVEKVTSALART